LLYPRNVKLDKEGNDINARTSFNYLSIQTRLGVKATGPDVLGAKTSALVEGAFFGQADSDVNDFRLRHAMMKLNWKSTELLLGQYWHVFFVTDCFPAHDLLQYGHSLSVFLPPAPDPDHPEIGAVFPDRRGVEPAGLYQPGWIGIFTQCGFA
jgi:hypothetical protein